MSMSKAKLVDALSDLELYGDESGAIAGWAAAWKSFFSNAFAKYTQDFPTYVVDQTTALKIGVNSILGVVAIPGSWIKVECLLTSEFEICESSYDTQNYIETVSLLGQVTPSTMVTDYRVTDAAIMGTDLDVPEAAMVSAMTGLSDENEAGNKIQAGVVAWWDELENNPEDYFLGATAIVAPAGLLGLAAALDTSFAENLAIDPPITKEDAIDNVADDFIAANTGGTVTIDAVTKLIE